MTDIANNLKSNFPAILIYGAAGLGAGLLLKKDAKKYAMIGAGIGAAVAAFGIKVPGVTRVGFDLFAHGVPAGGGNCRPGWCPGDQPHHPIAQRGGEGRGGGRHPLSPRELEEHRRRMMGGGGDYGRGFEHHRRHYVPPPIDLDQDDDDMPIEPHHHHHHHPHQWW